MLNYKIKINNKDEQLFKSLAKRLNWQLERISISTDQKVLEDTQYDKENLKALSSAYYYPSTFKLFVKPQIDMSLLKNNDLLNSLSRFPLSSKSYHLKLRVIENDETRIYFEVNERLKEVYILLVETLL